jgi:hypothetical protein
MRLMRRARGRNEVAPSAPDAVARAATSTGQPLPQTLMRKFESSVGADLSGVRVHTGTESAAAAESVSARAYTVSNDIHFGAGQYNPSSKGGERLLAHEVAHTVQQSGSAGAPQYKLDVSQPGDAAEVEADRAADAMITGERTAVSPVAATHAREVLYREPDPAQPDQQPPADPNASIQLTPAELGMVQAADSARRSALAAALGAIDALLAKRPSDDGDGGSGAPNLGPAEQRTVDCFDRQLLTSGISSSFWNVATRARALIAENQSLSGQPPYFADKKGADFAHVDQSGAVSSGIYFDIFLTGSNDQCRKEVITHEYFHLGAIGLQHHYDASTTEDALNCPHHMAELVFDIATGCVGGCSGGSKCTP